MEPLSSAALLSAGSSVLSAALSPASAPSSASLFAPFSSDNSGWTVATGGSKSQASAGLKLSPWLIGGLALLGVIAWIKTSKKN